MEIKEFYKLQESVGATKYKGNNLNLIIEKIEKGELKAPVTTYNNFYYNNGLKPIQKSKLKISYISKKENDKTYFRKKAVFGINQCIIDYNGLKQRKEY